MRSQVEAGSNDGVNRSGAGHRTRLGLLLALVSALVSATVVFSAAAAEQLPVTQFGGTGSGAEQMSAPGGVAVDPGSGDVYVADTGNNRIDKYSPTGTHLLSWGWGVSDGKSELETCTSFCEGGYAGAGAGQLNEVVGVAVDPTSGDVYALNRRDGQIQRFTAGGAFVETFGGYGPATDHLGARVAALNSFAIDPAGNVYVGDPFKSRIAKYDSAGTFVEAISIEPGPLTVDPAGDLYVATTGGETVHIFKPDGTPKGDLSLHESFGARALAINPANGNLIAEVTSGFEKATTYALKEINAANELVATTQIPGMLPPPSGFEALSFGLAAGAAASFPEHEPGAVYIADMIADHVLVRAAGKPGAPRIEGLEVGALSTNYADIAAALNPRGLATEYFVAWGSSPAYGNVSPATPGQLSAGFETESVGVHLTGLLAGATYHYKLVAKNAEGTRESTDQTFTTYPVGGPLGLPDGRAYEMVSPIEKGNNDVEDRGGIEQRGVAGTGESGITYTALNGLPGSESGALAVANAARRSPTGWASTAVSPQDINQTTLLTAPPVMFSNDLTKVLVGSRVDLTGNAPAGLNLYVHTLSPSSYQLVTPEGSGNLFAWEPRNAVGASNDFSHVFFQAYEKLTPDSPEGFTLKLYEWDGSQLRNVGIMPGETTPAAEGVTAYEPERHPVSESGSAVVFGSAAIGTVQVFRREGGETVEVSAPNPGVVDPEGAKAATFVGASADGSSVFFTSRGTLTDDAYTGESPGGETDLAPNLYRYDIASGELTDLTIDEASERGAAVGNAIVAANGQAAYFVAEGVLDPGATLGSPNLYRWSQGGGVEFIATLSPSDPIVQSGETPEAVTDENGDAVVFVSRAGLAGRAGAAGIPEIYHWSVSEGLACASCGSGLMRTGATMPAPQLKLGSGGGKPLSADGSKVFFTTGDALVTADTNGKQDVYEWEGGADRLLSTGTGNSNSYFIDASASGKDVFFATRDRLVSADKDENTDIYDAREGGGFPVAAPEPNPCEAEACRPPQAAAPAAPQLGSRNFDGPGNRKPGKKKPKPHKHKKQAKHKKKHHKQKSKARPAGKRG